MNIGDKIKKCLSNSNLQFNKDFEFNADLENHDVGNQNYYRLYYLNYHRIGEGYGIHSHNIGLINYSFDPFSFPNGITRSEGFKILSYLTDFIEKRDDVEECSIKSVTILNEILNLERLGFKRQTIDEEPINLFTVEGRLLLFKYSDLYQKYIEWYTDGVSFDEVKKIYSKIGIDFEDLKLVNNDETVQSLILRK